MKVFKFGGASIRSAEAVRKVANILKNESSSKIVVVLSAMGKTTNALEKILSLTMAGKDAESEWKALRDYHEGIMKDLFQVNHPVWKQVLEMMDGAEKDIQSGVSGDEGYDQIVSRGELISSSIVSQFLLQEKIQNTWIDARDYISTDSTFREGKIDWTTTQEKIKGLREVIDRGIILTQGFLGSTPDGRTTTLGREGSDFSAAIFAACLPAESVTIWKDVPGVMNADPKRIKEAIVFEELPYREAAEMTYYGASVIHPKTIKPLANKNIPLYVKNFDDPSLPGTTIHEGKINFLPPLIVFKDNQCLVSCRVTDYAFIDEQQLGFIFTLLSKLNIKINVMQNSATSFSFCIDFREDKILQLIAGLSENFEVYYNTGLTLITIKNYDTGSFEFYRKRPGILLEQSSRSTLQILVKD